MREKKYREGSLFAVPLKTDGYAVGLVARNHPKGSVILAYFFPKKYASVPLINDIYDLQPTDAFKVWMIGELGLVSGEWQIIGDLPNWNRDLWKVPNFVSREEFTNRIWLITYSDDNPNEIISRVRATEEEVKDLERDVLSGHGAVETKLSKLIK